MIIYTVALLFIDDNKYINTLQYVYMYMTLCNITLSTSISVNTITNVLYHQNDYKSLYGEVLG